jgi:PPM family protein phosphatase
VIEYSAWTHKGHVRKNNEDFYQIASLSNTGCLFLVADGIGGSAGGEIASRIAVEEVVQQLTSTAFSDYDECRKELGSAMQAAHRAVRQQAETEPDLSGMGTTLTMLALLNEKGIIAHAGDSRAYLWRAGKLTQITEDHTLSQEWVRDGKISPEEALFHPYQHMLTRALGVEPFPEADLITLDLQAQDRILICSDGLSNMVEESRLEEMVGTVTDMEYLCALLGQEALNRGGHDNITLITVLIGNEAEG